MAKVCSNMLAIALFVLSLATPAAAQTVVTGTLNAVADINTNCTASAGTAVDFGTLRSSQASGATAVGSVNVTCDVDIPYAVGLGYGAHATGGTTRNMTCNTAQGVQYLPYELYAPSAAKSAAYTTPVEPIVANTSETGVLSAATPGGIGTGSAQSIPIYAKILGSNPQPCASAYSDSVVIMLGY